MFDGAIGEEFCCGASTELLPSQTCHGGNMPRYGLLQYRVKRTAILPPGRGVSRQARSTTLGSRRRTTPHLHWHDDKTCSSNISWPKWAFAVVRFRLIVQAVPSETKPTTRPVSTYVHVHIQVRSLCALYKEVIRRHGCSCTHLLCKQFICFFLW